MMENSAQNQVEDNESGNLIKKNNSINMLDDNGGDEKIKNDSGLEICDSMDTMPELIPIDTHQFPICVEKAINVPDNFSFSLNKESKLPALFPLPSPTKSTKTIMESSEKSCGNSRSSSSSTSFIDALLDKFGHRKVTDILSDNSENENEEKEEELKKTEIDDLLEEIDSPITLEKSLNPNMLPTPVVKYQRIGSAFVNSDEEFERTIAKYEHERNQLQKQDKLKMDARSLPPKMLQPQFPNTIPKPRTLAEKRLLVNTNIGFLMIEQESKIYKQIQKKNNGEALNYQLIGSMVHEDIPIKYGSWKALQWLHTQEGNYIQQQINIDGVNYKLCGSIGDHQNKYLPQQTIKSYPKIQKTSLRSSRCCVGGKIKKKDIDQLVSSENIKKFILEESLEPFKRLEHKSFNSVQPCPLSKKILLLNANTKIRNASEDGIFLGEFMKYEMPDIKIEVNVEPKVPLNSVAKQYLYDILPSHDLNTNWIDFALSTIKTCKNDCNKSKKFEFIVPYVENCRNILVREILKAKEDTEKLKIFNSSINGDEDDYIDTMEWTFASEADKNDPVEMEVVEIIKDLTNSVFININDDLFTNDDPDDRTLHLYPNTSAKSLVECSIPVAMTTSSTAVIDPLTKKSRKILNELKRLNANVVKSESKVFDDEHIRRHATAHLGKEERELRATVIITDSATVLLSNTEKETKRRSRIPKRYCDHIRPQDSLTNDDMQDEPIRKKIKQNGSLSKPKSCIPEITMSHDDLKIVRQEVNKWLHVSVELNRMDVVRDIRPWCMIHNVYKCPCKNLGPFPTCEGKEHTSFVSATIASDSNETHDSSRNSSCCESSENDEHPSVELLSSRRVLPVEIKGNKSPQIETIQNTIQTSYELPKMEILNISDLVNDKKGPIFINIFDTKKNRLNHVFRTILNSKCALIYIDGYGYYVNTLRVDVMKMKFDDMTKILVHPIFIIQPKISMVSNHNTSDFFSELLFNKEDSNMIKDIQDKNVLKEISSIVEVVLRSTKKKIETQIYGEPNEHVKNQLNLIYRERLQSESTCSSTSSVITSPLHFNDKKLEVAPSPGHDSELMKEFNRIFSRRMQLICGMIKTNSTSLHVSESFMNKFYIYRWRLLLQAFESQTIHIWQAKIQGESGKSYLMLVLTNINKPPTIANVVRENVVNIRKLSLADDETTDLTRYILLRAENLKTEFMTVVLYGCIGYFRICGLLHAKENFVDKFVAIPTRVAHPRLSAKIQKIYNIWYRIKRATMNYKPKERSDTRNLVEIKEENESKERKKYSKKNIEEKTQQVSKFKWFLFNITDDFSHIYFKLWKKYLPYEIVIGAIQKARQTKRTIQLIPNEMKEPFIYAVPNPPLKFKDQLLMTKNFLIVGPYLRTSNSNLSLMQYHNGRMLLRDDYQKKLYINRKIKTRCIWIYADALKCIQNVKTESMYFSWKGNKEEPNNEHDLKIAYTVGVSTR